MKIRIAWSLTALVVLAACPKHKPEPCSSPQLLVTRSLVSGPSGPCTGLACGGGANSPFTNVFPVNGLDSAGTCNVDGIRLVPGSLVGGQCPDGATLAIDADGKALVGTKGGTMVCSGTDLKGAKFQVIASKAIDLSIADVRTTTKDDGNHTGYKIQYGNKQVCDYNASVAALVAMGVKITPIAVEGPSPAGYTPITDDELAIAMPGPIFSVRDGAKTSDSAAFFNLACSGDALAKSMFYELASTAYQTTAALRMITARYDQIQPFTVRGMTVGFTPGLSTLNPTTDPHVEAIWNADGGAACLATPRLLDLIDSKTNQKLTAFDKLPEGLQPEGCLSFLPGKFTCPSSTAWAKAVATQAGSSLKSCIGINVPPHGLVSYVDAAGFLVLTKHNLPLWRLSRARQ
ncbi:MAG TPA: ADYC domain-containing protein [Kofleriaceae bacterium]|jgi:hypothetical protein